MDVDVETESLAASAPLPSARLKLDEFFVLWSASPAAAALFDSLLSSSTSSSPSSTTCSSSFSPSSPSSSSSSSSSCALSPSSPSSWSWPPCASASACPHSGAAGDASDGNGDGGGDGDGDGAGAVPLAPASPPSARPKQQLSRFSQSNAASIPSSSIPRFYFPNKQGSGMSSSSRARANEIIEHIFSHGSEGLERTQCGQLAEALCGLPSFTGPLLFDFLSGKLVHGWGTEGTLCFIYLYYAYARV